METLKDVARPLLGPAYRKYRLWRWRRRLHVIFIPTYRCNYRCPYCDVWKLADKFRERDLDEWIRWFYLLPNSIVDVTGGEPFLYREWFDLVASMPSRHRMAVTTNLSYDVARFGPLWSRLTNVTVSFHPHTVELVDFITKLKRLKRYREKVSCNIVGYPDFLCRLPEFIEKIQSLGVYVNVDPYIHEDYQYTEEENRLVEEARSLTSIQSTRRIGFAVDDVGVPKMCDAGIRHFLVVPDGSAYTCMCGYFQDPTHHYMGNVLEPRWTPRTTKILCEVSCSCGCDLDWVKPSVIKSHRM